MSEAWDNFTKSLESARRAIDEAKESARSSSTLFTSSEGTEADADPQLFDYAFPNNALLVWPRNEKEARLTFSYVRTIVPNDLDARLAVEGRTLE
jgi:hypothetical protein